MNILNEAGTSFSGISEITDHEGGVLKNELLPSSNEIEFQFNVATPSFAYIGKRDCKEKLTQWGLDAGSIFKEFHFSRNVQAGQYPELIKQFFNSKLVQQAFATDKSARGEFGAAVVAPSGNFRQVEISELRTTLTSTKIFDKLKEANIVGTSGGLRGCMDQLFDGATACNLVTEMFLNPDSDAVDLLNENEQNELLVHMFKRLCVGGSVCQNDTHTEPYLAACRRMYKDFVTVVRDEATGSIKVASKAFKVESLDGSHAGLFRQDNPNNFCYVIVDPLKQFIRFWSYSFVPFW